MPLEFTLFEGKRPSTTWIEIVHRIRVVRDKGLSPGKRKMRGVSDQMKRQQRQISKGRRDLYVVSRAVSGV